MKIFIMDDERLICNFLTDILSIEGHSTITVSSIREAVSLIENETFDLAIVDFRMIDGYGTEIVRLIKTLRPGIKVIGMSATEQGNTFYRAGAEYFIEKPFNIDHIQEVLRELGNATN